ncbi:Gfo/Idh/MocA family protein [Cellulosimicrobium cellulans]|uniref:Gfo/Idh/MocA family protein n=1 Tax=Cellulosimicrobium cellulans TaxID=1710 RepID=UPI00165281D4|nr:Gfo/Idh/MocA family oxidoreductase [Cellulosimicrobium cellulans]
MAAELRAGLVGLGSMGRHHARVLREMPGVELVGAVDPTGDPYGVAADVPVYREVAELIAAGVDMAVVAAPTVTHEPVGLELAAAGVHTMVEKPIAADVAGAQRLVDAFDAAGLVGAVGHIERFNPALQALRSRVLSGELGDVYQIVTRRQGPFPQRIADVGVVKDLATHDIDLTAWIAGSPYTTVAAQVAARSGREHEDLVAATGRLANGTVVNHLVNWLSPMKERLTMVTGERGAFVADTIGVDLTYYANGTFATEWDSVANFRGVTEGDVTRFALAKREPLRLEHEAFRDAVLGVRDEVVSLREGLATLRVAESLLEASDTGRTVTLPA